MLSDILSAIAIIMSLASLLVSIYFGWYRIRKERPLLKHEVFSCKHKVSRDGKSTELELEFKVHNGGDRGTQLNRIEVYATDFKGEGHQSSYDLSKVEYLDATDSTKKIRAFFSFSPSFQYRIRMPCRFTIYHTTREYSFDCESKESEHHLGIQVSTGRVPW